MILFVFGIRNEKLTKLFNLYNILCSFADPLPVVNLAANPMSPTEAELQWSANVNSQQDGYQYRYSTRGSDIWTAWAGSVSNTVLVNQLYPGQSYVFEVQAKSGDRTSTSSSVTTTLRKST